MLKQEYCPSEGEKAAVKLMVEGLKTAPKEEVIEAVVAAVSRQAAASVVIEAGVERLDELGVGPDEVAKVIFEGGV